MKLPQSTKDGVTVAKSLDMLQSQIQSLGSKLIIDAANKSCEESGDGTTTCTIIANSILAQGSKVLSHDPHEAVFIRRGIKLAVSEIKAHLQSQAIKITKEEEVHNLALQSSNYDDFIAKCILEIYQKVGLNGAISIQEGNGFSAETVVEFQSGLQIDSGYLSPYFAQGCESATIEFSGNSETVYIAAVCGQVDRAHELTKLLEFAKKTQRPLVIFATEFSSEALQALVMNKL